MKKYHYRESLNSTMNKVIFFDSLKSSTNKSIVWMDVIKKIGGVLKIPGS